MRAWDYIKSLKAKIQNKFGLTLLLSLIIHLVISILYIDNEKFIKNNNLKDKKFKVVLRNIPKKKTSSPKIKKEKEKEKRKQIVNNEETGKKEKPKESKFLGKINQKYNRETTAKKIGIFKEAGKGVRTGVQNKAKKLVKKSKPKIKAKKSKKKLSLSDLKFATKTPIKKFKNTMSSAKGLENGKLGKLGLARNNDYIEDLPLGDFTNLNTVEFKYYGFYHRIRQQLEQHWGNSLRKKAKILYKKGRRLASESKITSLKVTLDQQGNIVKVFLKSTSGINELDDAAIESFNKAGPFPNPPKGMMINGQAEIEWGFVVKG